MSQGNERVTTRRRAFLPSVGLLVILALLGQLLTACGAADATSTAVPVATTAPAPTTAAATSAPAAADTATTAPAPTTAAATSAPAATGDQVINMLWTDTDNLRQPLIADFTKATGIKVNQVQVQYNELLDKINTSVQGGGDTDVIEMDTIWTAQFASAGWIEDLTNRIGPDLKQDIPESSLSAVTYQGKLYGMPWFNSAKHPF